MIARIVISMNMVARTRNKSAAQTEDRIYSYSTRILSYQFVSARENVEWISWNKK